MRIKYLSFFIMFIFCSTWTNVSANEEQVLRISGWDVYSDPVQANKTIGYQSFEEKTGITIDFTPQNNLSDIVSSAESSTDFDVFIISNEGIKILHDMQLTTALELSHLPYYQDLHHNLKYSEWSQFESRIHAVPWAWGPTGLLYDKDIIKNVNSWNTLWDPKLKGKIAMWDDVSMIWTTALLLGFENVYSLTKNQLHAVQQKLLELNRHSPVYYKGGGEELELAKSGKLVAFNGWYDPSSRINVTGRNFEMIIPKEGAVGMFDSYMVSKSSKHKDIAYQYINHQISPEIQLQMVRVTGLAPANIETLGLLEPNEVKALHLDEPDYFNRMILWDHMPRKSLYDDVLKKVRQDRQKKQ